MVTRSAAGQAGQHARGGLRQRLETERPDASAPSARAVRPAPSGAAASHRARLTSGDALDALALGFGVTSGSATQSPSALESGSYPSDLQTRHASAVSARPSTVRLIAGFRTSSLRHHPVPTVVTRPMDDGNACRSYLSRAGRSRIRSICESADHGAAHFPLSWAVYPSACGAVTLQRFRAAPGSQMVAPHYGQVTLRARKCCAGGIVRGNLIR